MIETNPLLFDKLKDVGLPDDEIETIKEYIIEHGDLENCPNVPDKLKDAFVVASQVSWEDHILMQAAWQEYITNAVSKTVNCPNETTEEDIFSMYLCMHENKLKGSTVYRDGSKMFQVLEKGKS
jgi:ribonucleoside-diphosphate reductase alpha chain